MARFELLELICDEVSVDRLVVRHTDLKPGSPQYRDALVFEMRDGDRETMIFLNPANVRTLVRRLTVWLHETGEL